ncbi:MAG: double-strand break repair protein AddB [Hyphomicrobiaceae bacterium]|nr:double-strand break repair protein AddB [Hyphomicrobiaceae bacterium]
MAGSIFTVPLGAPFLDTTAAALLAGDLPRLGGAAPDPLDLPEITILLPTKRAARALQDAFLKTGDARAMLLPRIRAIGAGEEDQLLIQGLADLGAFAGDLDVPPAVTEMERRLVMTQLVQRWSDSMRSAGEGSESAYSSSVSLAAGARTPAQAISLASELCRLMDMLETEGVGVEDLGSLVPDEHSQHWQQTLEFLRIIIAWWPDYLATAGKLSPAERRNRLIRGEAARLTATPPKGPIIVAGVTGSIPATAELMKAVAALPNGAVVLPGLDLGLDEESWSLLNERHPEHPQFGLAQLLGRLGVTRADVQSLRPAEVEAGTAYDQRALLLSEAMRPAETTDRWHTLDERLSPGEARTCLEGVTALVAPTAQDEAEVIALLLREALEHEGQTAALVTPDRLLARRVTVRLEGLGIRVDDSAGRPFAKTVPGSFLDLVVEAGARRFAPKPLAALLKHPLTRLAMPAIEVRRAARALEIIAFRAAYLGVGLDGIKSALDQAAEAVTQGTRRGAAVRRLWDEDWQAARALVDRLENAYAPLEALSQGTDEHPLAAFVSAHVAVAETLARIDAEDTEASQLWRDEAGQTAALLFANLESSELPELPLRFADYPDFYRALIGSEAVRPTLPTHPRVSIWGPFEARLQKPDLVILGSLNEGTWPQAADPGPWLNRPMRARLALPLPEEQIGRAAHDVVQLFGAKRVYLTRAEKVEGDPTVPSRWLLRLDAVLGGLGATEALEPQRPWLAWARARDLADADPRPVAAPEPRPPVALRPRRLSVSAIETWIANPYALFASRILELDPLPPLGREPGADLRGSIVHDALGRFAGAHPQTLPAHPGDELLAEATRIFEAYHSHPRVRAFWIERFKRFAQWFDAHEPLLRSGATNTLAELSGKHALTPTGGIFEVTARADRIDLSGDGLIISDYKTAQGLGVLSSRAKQGLAPQLLLEAMIAAAGGFDKLHTPLPVKGLRYISASGGEPPGQIVDVKVDDIAAAVAQISEDLTALIDRFDDPATPYKAVRRQGFDYGYDDFAHLARVKEWSSAEPSEDAA